MERPLLTIQEAASLLNVPKSWLYARTRRRGADALPHHRVGRYVRFTNEDLDLIVERLRPEGQG